MYNIYLYNIYLDKHIKILKYTFLKELLFRIFSLGKQYLEWVLRT